MILSLTSVAHSSSPSPFFNQTNPNHIFIIFTRMHELMMWQGIIKKCKAEVILMPLSPTLYFSVPDLSRNMCIHATHILYHGAWFKEEERQSTAQSGSHIHVLPDSCWLQLIRVIITSALSHFPHSSHCRSAWHDTRPLCPLSGSVCAYRRSPDFAFTQAQRWSAVRESESQMSEKTIKERMALHAFTHSHISTPDSACLCESRILSWHSLESRGQTWQSKHHHYVCTTCGYIVMTMIWKASWSPPPCTLSPDLHIVSHETQSSSPSSHETCTKKIFDVCQSILTWRECVLFVCGFVEWRVHTCSSHSG